MNELIFQSEETKEYSFAYEVHFRFSSECYLSHEQRSKGDMVIVHCERGYNIGFIDRELQYHEFYNLSNRYPKAKKILAGLPIDDKKIREMLTTKINAENHALEECRTHCQGRRIGALADIVGAEFQFDRKKLTIFIKLYENVSVCRLVRKLYDTFKMRVKVLEVNSIEAVEKLTKKYLQLSKLNISESLIFSSPPPRPTSVPSNSSENDDLDDKEKEQDKEKESQQLQQAKKDKQLQQEQSNQQQKIDAEMKNLLNKQKQQQQQQQQKQIHQLQRQHQVLQTAATVAANMNANMNQQQKRIKQPHFTNNYQYLQDSNQYQSQYLQQYHQQQINNYYNNSNQHHHHHQQQQHGNHSILSHLVHNNSNNNNHHHYHHHNHHYQQQQHGDYNDLRLLKNQNNFMGYNHQHHHQQQQHQQSRSYHSQQYHHHHQQQQQQLPMNRKPIQQHDMSSYLPNYHQVEHQQKHDSNYPSSSSSPSIPSSILSSSYYSVTSPISLSGASSPSHYSSSHSDMESLYDDIPINTLPLSLLPNENYLSELNYNHLDEGSFSNFNLRQPKAIASALGEVTTSISSSSSSSTTTTRDRSTISMGLEVPLPVHHSENCYDLDLSLNYLSMNEKNQNSFLFPNREANLFEDFPVYSFTQSIIGDNNNNNIDDSDSIESLVASLTLPSDNYTNTSLSTTPTISTSSSPITCMFDNHFSLLPVESLSGVVVPSKLNNFNNNNHNNYKNSTNESVQSQQETKSPTSSCYILQSAQQYQ